MIDVNKYDFDLPAELIADKPAVPRDHSRLLVYNTRTDAISFDYFYHLDKYLPANSFVVLNNTKVIPARILLRKKTGGKVITLLLVNEIEGNIIKAFADRKVVLGDKLYINPKYFLTVIDQDEKIFYLKFDFSKEKLIDLLIKKGRMPVPLYLRKTPLKESQLRRKYQTIFAEKDASAAAPTASLHFSQRVFSRLDEKGIKKLFITLNVGLGTFAPINITNIMEKKLHKEYFNIPEETADKIRVQKSQGRKCIAIGTTVVRTLESCKQPGISSTDLFIFPPYEFKTVDCLITNFHIPKSSLMLLVDAFLKFKKAKRNVIELYKIAVRERFRFYSFGDAMLIL